MRVRLLCGSVLIRLWLGGAGLFGRELLMGLFLGGGG